MLEDVRSVFLRVANHRDGMTVPDYSNMHFLISGSLHAMHVNLYRESRIMIDQLERVLNDGEHRQVIEEGRTLRMRMPDTESFRLRIEAFRAHLDSYDPRQVTRLPDGRVQIPLRIARSTHTTNLLATSFVYDFFSEIQRTDYLKYLRQLRAQGFMYAGPICVQEVFNPYLTLHYLAAFLKQETSPEKLPVNWMRRATSDRASRGNPPPLTVP
ncbi:MAG: hypothetical protein HYS17_11515 [Micavibrio aeruginosavorus]|uniref:Uncharacterized protein n=1 Tax=Micavibrio aeruginosavorus TaxID=349221 RepID=A0A7T5UH69_9BACT|nr:MAG: hypothetical protein HYS17_11515 [Micavibrio aeruginosavorus]